MESGTSNEAFKTQIFNSSKKQSMNDFASLRSRQLRKEKGPR